MADSAAASAPTCAGCNDSLEFLGRQGIRMGGTGGGWIPFLGNLAEVGEWIWEVAVFRCAGCGRYELYDKDSPAATSARQG
jgi:hypothetical protein